MWPERGQQDFDAGDTGWPAASTRFCVKAGASQFVAPTDPN